MTTRTTTLVAAVAATFAIGGCAREMEEEFAEGLAQSAIETPDNQKPHQDLAGSLEDGCALSAEDAAREAALRPSVGVYGSECVTKTADGNRVHVEFDGCTGPFGRVTLDGGLDAVFSVEAETCLVRADIVDDGTFEANGRPFDYSAGADIEVLPDAREIDWSAQWYGTTRRDRDIEQTSQLDVHLDHASSCVSVRSGKAEGTVGGYDYGWTMSGLDVCPDECPSAGVVEGWWKGEARKRRVVVEFDGSDVARVTGWTGRQFDVDLVCNPAAR
jgi:hypothetical protein